MRPELAHILRSHAQDLSPLSNDEARVVKALTACRTAALGGHKQRCDHCGRETPVYNSCRNRHCPKCQSLDQALWVEAQIHDLLPVLYFHEVFTLPPCLHPFFRRDPSAAYALLFEAAAKTVIDVCRTHLGATPGLIAVLHTWNQQLGYLPHIHCITTGGGLSLERTQWIGSRPDSSCRSGNSPSSFEGNSSRRLNSLSPRASAHPEAQAASCCVALPSRNSLSIPSPPWPDPNRSCATSADTRTESRSRTSDCLEHRDDHVTFSYKDRPAASARPRRCPGRSSRAVFLTHVVPRRFVRISGTTASSPTPARTLGWRGRDASSARQRRPEPADPARVLATDLLAHRRHRSAPLSHVRCWSAARRRGDPALGSARQDHPRFEVTVTATSASPLGHRGARRLTPLVCPVRVPSTALGSKPFAPAAMDGRSPSPDNFPHRRRPNRLTSPYPRLTPAVQSP